MKKSPCLAGIVLALACWLPAGCESKSTPPARAGAPEPAAERGAARASAPPQPRAQQADRAVVLHVAGMMKSKGGAT
jgi:hypothetical protein